MPPPTLFSSSFKATLHNMGRPNLDGPAFRSLEAGNRRVLLSTEGDPPSGEIRWTPGACSFSNGQRKAVWVRLAASERHERRRKTEKEESVVWMEVDISSLHIVSGRQWGKRHRGVQGMTFVSFQKFVGIGPESERVEALTYQKWQMGAWAAGCWRRSAGDPGGATTVNRWIGEHFQQPFARYYPCSEPVGSAL